MVPLQAELITITSMVTLPDNTFDNQLTAAGTDSGVFIQVNPSKASPDNYATDPDGEGGFRIEIYDGSGNLKRRLADSEVVANPAPSDPKVRFDGQGDSVGSETLAYGSYTMRTYASFDSPSYVTKVSGNGITIDRPGDLHVTSGGVLSWTNTGSRLGFCQVSIGNPNVDEPTFLRLVDFFDTATGATNDDDAYGIAVNSAGDIFVSDNAGVSGQARVMKYDVSAETWMNVNWYRTDSGTDPGFDEALGLGIDNKDSVYVAFASAVVGGGKGGAWEGVIKLKDGGNFADLATTGANTTKDLYDVSPVPSGISSAFTNNSEQGRAIKANNDLTSNNTNFFDYGGTSRGSMWTTTDTSVYIADATNNQFEKYDSSGAQIYVITDATKLDDASGIAVWERSQNSQFETYVFIGGATSNQIAVFKESPGGTTAYFVRLITDDVYNLNQPSALAIDPDSALFVMSAGQKAVKKFTIDGVFQNLPDAVNGKFIQGSDASADLSDATGFKYPQAIVVDDTGSIYVFDHDATSAPANSAIKKFTDQGASSGVIKDIDAASAFFDGVVVQAVWGNNSIYAVTNDEDFHCIRFDQSGAILAHLGDRAFGADAAEGDINNELVGVSVGPFYDRANKRFYPDAVYLLDDLGDVYIWKSDLSGQIATYADANPALPTLENTYGNGFLVDKFGAIYVLDGNTSGGHDFHGYVSERVGQTGFKSAFHRSNMAQGSSNGQLNGSRQMMWTDNAGVFLKNQGTNKYERKIWVVDKGNNRLEEFLLRWNSYVDSTIIITQAQDTPLVMSATISGDTVTTISGTYYVGADTDVNIQINFSKAMWTDSYPAISFKPNGGSFITIESTAYSSGNWSGTFTVTAAMADGEAILKVANAYDGLTGATSDVIDPNPDQTDFDAGDDFKPFVIDNAGPVNSVSSPGSGGDSTAEASYTVSGQVTNEATGLDATILMEAYYTSSGDTVFDSTTVTASSANGNFSGNIDLRGPAPTNNYLQVTATDKVGNKTLLASRRLIQREKNVGTAFIEPSSETVVGALRRYQITYTAAQAITNDTLRFTMPTSWSAPQDAVGTTNGYVTVTIDGSYSDSTITGAVVEFTGCSLAIGKTLVVNYGDSVVSNTGRSKSSIDASLASVDNTFKVDLKSAGETTFTGVGAASGKTLVVSLKDSNVGVAVRETGPLSGETSTVGKGSDTRIMILRFFNTNIGEHFNKITQVKVDAQSNTGAAVNWNGIASNVKLKNTEEGITFADVSSMPQSQTLNITPSTLFTVAKGQTRDMEIHVTFSPTAVADTVKFFISAVSDITSVDSASGKTLTVSAVETGLAATAFYDLVGLEPADTMAIGYIDANTDEVATSQQDVTIMKLVFENREVATETPVNSARIDEVKLQMRRDDGSTALNANAILSDLKLIDANDGTQYGGVTPGASETLTISLSGLVIASGESKTIRVEVDINANTTTTSAFRLRLGETTLVTSKDKVTNLAMDVIDPSDLSGVLPFMTDTITVKQTAAADLEEVILLREDSTSINGALGDQIVTAEVFYVRLKIKPRLNKSAVRVIPADSDLVFRIDGTNRSSEFTVTPPAAQTIQPGVSANFDYNVVQNLGSTTGKLAVSNDTTASDSRPRAFDDHDYALPDMLRAGWFDTVVDTATLASAPQQVTVHGIDTAYASPAETGQAVMKFEIKNNRSSDRLVDAVTVNALSAGTTVILVRLFHDDDDSILELGSDSQVASGTLNANDTVQLSLSPKISLGPNGDTAVLFVTFDFETAIVDGDTIDAKVPALGIKVLTENNFPSTEFNSNGNGIVEIVAKRVTMTPDTGINAIAASPSFTLKAVDAKGNIDNLPNSETTVQGHNVQVDITLTAADADTTHHITGASGMSNVSPTPAVGVQVINGNLSSGQGVVTITDTEAETVAVAMSSVLTDSTGGFQFASLITATAENLIASDSALPESVAVTVLAVRVINQSGAADSVTSISVTSLNTYDTDIDSVILFADANKNGFIDSGTDTMIGSGIFTNGLVVFTCTMPVANGDSKLFMVGYDITRIVNDKDVIDARIDTLVVASAGQNLAAVSQNSSPDRKINVAATRLSMTPTSQSGDAGTNMTVTIKAVDSRGNKDKDYTGGTGITIDLEGSAAFQSSTLVNQDIDPAPDPPYDNSLVKGNLSNGEANLTFLDNTSETIQMTFTAAPGLSGTHDTGTYVFNPAAIDPGVGSASPSSESQVVGTLNRYVIEYKAQANLAGDTVRFTIPAAWSAPQKTSTTTNGYFLLRTNGTYGDSRVSGQTITCTGVTLSNGDTIQVFYGDSTASLSGRAGPSDNAALDNASNTFKLEAYFGSDTAFRNSPAEGGKTLTVSIRDSDISVAVIDTAASSGTVTVAKGTDTRIMSVRVFNSNIGAHSDKITQVRLNVQTDTGGGIDMDKVVSRVVVKNTGEGITFADVSSIPSNSNMAISLSNFTVAQSLSRDMEIHVTIDALATADTVRFFLSDLPSGMTGTDSASGNVLQVLEKDTGVDSGIRTGGIDIIGYAPAETIAIGFTDPASGTLGTGQKGVSAMKIRFENRNPNTADTPVNNVKITKLKLQMRQSDGTTAMVPNNVLGKIYVIDDATATEYGNVVAPSSGDTLTIDLAGFELASADSKTVRIEVDVAGDTTSNSAFRLRLGETTLVTATDKVTGGAVNVVIDSNLPFLISTVAVIPVAEATVQAITLLKEDSTVINGAAGDQIIIGDVFYAAFRVNATLNRGAARVQPLATDLKVKIGGIDKTGEFSIAVPADFTIAAGSIDTIFYRLVQDSGTTTGSLSVNADTSSETRPRIYDAKDYSDPNKLSAAFEDASPGTAAIASAKIQTAALTLDTTWANPGETAVEVVKFSITNNVTSTRAFDSLVVNALSAGTTVTKVRVYHDDRDGAFERHSDSMVGSGTLGASTDTVLIDLDTNVNIGPNGDSAIIFVAFDFDTKVDDGDTVDANIPPQGISIAGESAAPSASSLSSVGQSAIEVVATRVTATPDTQIVAKSASPTVTLKAVDQYGNIDNIPNVEAGTQGHNIQIQIDYSDSDHIDTKFHITATSGMTNVSPTPAVGVQSINGKLSSGQGVVTFTDSANETTIITLSSTLTDSTGYIQYASLVSAVAVNLSSGDSAGPESTAFMVLKFRVTNSSGSIDTVTTVALQSLNTADTEVDSALLFHDANGNWEIDSGTDTLLATASFSGGIATFSGISVRIEDGDSEMFMVGYDIGTSATDANVMDARADTITLAVEGEKGGASINSTPNRKIDIKAKRIKLVPTSGNTATATNFTVSATAVDSYGNIDVAYTGNLGGGQKVQLQVSGNAQIQASSTFDNEDISPANTVDGNLAAGKADLVFQDATSETVDLTVTVGPGLVGAHSAGAYTIDQGFVVTALDQSYAEVLRDSTNRVILRFKIAASGGTSDTLSQIQITWKGNDTRDVSNVRLYKDQNGSLSWDAADTFFDTGAKPFVSETVTFISANSPDTVYIADGTEKAFFLIADVSSTATYSDTLDAAIRVGAITTVGGLTPIPKGERNSLGWETVVATTGWTVTVQTLTDQVFVKATKEQVLASAVFKNTGALRDTLTKIVITDLGNYTVETDIVDVSLWGDLNNNGVFDTGTDTFILASAFDVGETAGFTISRGINSGASETYFFVARIPDSPTVSSGGETISIRFAASGSASSLLSALPSANVTHAEAISFDFATFGISADSSNAGHTQALASGADSAIVYVVVSTDTGYLVSDTTVTISSSKGAADTIWPTSCTTNASGVCTFSVSSRSTTKSKLTVTMGLYRGLNETPTITWLDTQTAVTLGFGASHPETSFFNVDNGAFILWPAWRADGRALAYISKANTTEKWNVFTAFDDGTNGDTSADDGMYMTKKVTNDSHYVYHASRPAWIDVLNSGGTRDSDGTADIVFASKMAASRIHLLAVRADGSDNTKDSNQLVSLTLTSVNGRFTMPVHPAGSQYIYVVSQFEVSRFPFSQDPITGTFKSYQHGEMTHLTSVQLQFVHNQMAAEASTKWVAVDIALADTNKIAVSMVNVLPNTNRYQRGLLFVGTNAETAAEDQWLKINDTTTFLAYRAETMVAWNLSWDTTKSVLTYCVDNTGNFSWQNFDKFDTRPDYAYASTDFDVMGLYVNGSHATPNKPVALINNSGTSNDLSLTFSPGDTARVAYIAYDKDADTISLKIVEMDGRTTVDQTGGVLFENGKITAIIDEGDVLSGSINISVQTPSAVPASTTSDSIALTGNAREFFPDGQQFNDSITVILYYDTADLTAAGLNNNADSENLLKIYWYDGSGWRDMHAVVDPSDRNGALGSLSFVTTHFSIYAIGYSVVESSTVAGDTYSALWKAIYRLGGDRAIAGETITLTLEVKDSSAKPAKWPTDAVILIDGDTWTGETKVVSPSATSITTRFDTPGEKVITVRDADSSVSFALLVIAKQAAQETFVIVSGRKGIGQRIYSDDTSVTVILKSRYSDTAGTRMMIEQLPGETAISWTSPSSYDSPLTYWEARPISPSVGMLRVVIERSGSIVHRDSVAVLARTGSFRENADTSIASVEVVIESGTVDTPVTIAMLRTVSETSYQSANSALSAVGRNLVSGSVISLEAEDIDGNRIAAFARDIKLKLPATWEAGLRVVYLDNGKWKEVDGMTFDTATNTAKVEVNHLSVWGVTAGFTAGPGVESVRVYPNPWRSDGPASGSAHNAYGIKFDLLPAGSVNFKILTITGQLVLEGALNPSVLGATASNGHLQVIDLPLTGRVTRWDLRNQSGHNVASGTYIIILNGPGGQAVRKVAVIR